MENEKNKPISMGNLVNSKNTPKIKMIALTIISTFVVLAFVFLSVSYFTTSSKSAAIGESASTITLSDNIIAYAPEIKSIIFLNRKSHQVKFILDESVTTGIYALKSSDANTDYSAAFKNKTQNKK